MRSAVNTKGRTVLSLPLSVFQQSHAVCGGQGDLRVAVSGFEPEICPLCHATLLLHAGRYISTGTDRSYWPSGTADVRP